MNPKRRLVKASSKGGRKVVPEVVASFKEGRMRGAIKTVEELLIEGDTVFESSIEEEAPEPKKRLIKKGPTLSQALKA